MNQTTMGTLATWEPPPDEAEFFRKIIEILDEVYPENWRAWEVNDVSFEDLFGKSISSDDENRLRFAIPTVDLALAYGCSSLSERKYKQIKRTLLRWPLGRALIYAPFATMKKVHPTEAYNDFANHLLTIKNRLIAQKDAAQLLKNQYTDEVGLTPSRSRSEVSTAPSTSRKRSHSPEPNQSVLKEFMEKQTKLLTELLMVVKESNQTPGSVESPEPDETWELEDELEPEGSVPNDWEAPSIVELSSREAAEQEEENFLDFAPDTKESEAKIGTADDSIVKQGAHCQRLGEPAWQNIRFADVQKQFQATPVFTSLKTNSNLATATPSWQTVTLLEKMDARLGAITHGLLQQRKQFQEIYSKATLEIKSHISKNFLASDSAFRRTSDSLLQYTCGERAEIIQQRRSVYKPSNKTLNELLHAIPPSKTHLFSEPQLSKLIKDQGGTSKFFPARKQLSSTAYKARAQYKSSTNQERREKSRYNERRPNFRTSEQAKKRPFPSSATSGKSKRPRFEGKPKA